MTELVKPRGTRDFLPDDTAKRRFLEQRFRNIVQSWGYGEIVTPVFEDLELFKLKSGEGVLNEIYYFKDKGGRDLALRPELTAPTMRAYVNEMQSFSKPIRLFYFENCFRYERPQKGRFREFWQFGTEIIGSNKPAADAESIALAMNLIAAAGINGNLSIGNLSIVRHILNEMTEKPKARDKIMRLIDKKELEALDNYLVEINADSNLVSDLKQLISISGNNSAEVLLNARSIVGDLPEIDAFEKTLQILRAYGILDFKIDFGIARGLDYYTGMVFEIYAKGLGAQKQICGGGSYKLIPLFGGGDVASVGFGIGFDRIMEIYNEKTDGKATLSIITKPATYDEGIRLAMVLRQHVCTTTDIMDRNFATQLKYANLSNADYVLIVGEKEIESGKYSLKNMQTGEQKELTEYDLIHYFSAND